MLTPATTTRLWSSDFVLTCRDISIDLLRRRACVANRPVHLYTAQIAYFAYLILHPNRDISAAELFAACGKEIIAGREKAIANSVRTTIQQMENVLGRKYIETSKSPSFRIDSEEPTHSRPTSLTYKDLTLDLLSLKLLRGEATHSLPQKDAALLIYFMCNPIGTRNARELYAITQGIAPSQSVDYEHIKHLAATRIYRFNNRMGEPKIFIAAYDGDSSYGFSDAYQPEEPYPAEAWIGKAPPKAATP